MDCPVCKKSMVVLELDAVEIDHCMACGGIWLDAGELELLLDAASERNAVLGSLVPDKEIKEKKRRCPICLKKMEKVSCGKDKKVLIDKCRKNHGLWFDRNELCEVISRASLDKNNKIVAMLSDMFGKNMAKQKCTHKPES